MPTVHVNGIDMHYETQGTGPPLVLVHGSWADHTDWAEVTDTLAESFRVISYDRRGHSASGRTPGARTRRQDEDDLAALIEALDCAPARIAANSFGGLVALGLAARRPELVHRITAHEPPALSLGTGSELERLAAEAAGAVQAVLAELEAGRAEVGARRFIDEIALGPGAWDELPEAVRAVCLTNAEAFLAEQRDRDWAAVDVDALAPVSSRILLTQGDVSPRWLRLVADRLAELLPGVRTARFAGAGHVPHVTHPAEYAELVTRAMEVGQPVAGR